VVILLKVNLANLAILLNKVVILLKDNPDNPVTLLNKAATLHNKAAIPLKDNPVILLKVCIKAREFARTDFNLRTYSIYLGQPGQPGYPPQQGGYPPQQGKLAQINLVVERNLLC
jgi:hypothetical protein